jgi:hypothetical protein
VSMTANQRRAELYHAANLECARIIAADPSFDWIKPLKTETKQ